MKGVIKEELLYSPSEVASALRVSPVTVSRAIRAGKLKAYRFGGQWRILGSELFRFVNEETECALRKDAGETPAPAALAG